MCCMLCTELYFGYEYWCYIYHNISYTVYCCVMWALPLCALSTAASYVTCCVLPHVLCLRYCYFTYCILCTAICLYCGHYFALYMYAVLPCALCHGYCCFMYCMWCVSTTDILLHCASRHGYFLLMLCLCASLLYMIIDHGVANDCTDVISLVYILLIS